jgi:uncharacterized Tic20 family protein
MEKPGQKIALARKAKGLSQEKLSDEAKINLRTLQRIEKGETNPHGDTILRISKALNIPIEDLMNYGAEENTAYIKSMHFSALIFLFFPTGNILLPLILWLTRKNDIQNISFFAKNLINFQITWTIMVGLPFIWIFVCKLFNLNFSTTSTLISPFFFIVFYLMFYYLFNILYLIIVGILITKNTKNYFPIAIRFIR